MKEFAQSMLHILGLGEDDEFISQKRSIYHFYRDKNSGIIGFLKKWKKWKIYMLVDTEVESAQS